MENRQSVYRDTGLNLDLLKEEASSAVKELVEAAGLKKGQIFVTGCSTSEICGDMIGSNSSLDVALAVFNGIYETLNEYGIYLAAQCCEHLNRAIIIEREAASGNEIVSVVPQPKAGGSFATCAYYSFKDPVVLESVKADAGIDIGGVLIGMQLKHVAVPVRLKNDHIGSAKMLAARTRPKSIGGIRAIYEPDEEMAALIRKTK